MKKPLVLVLAVAAVALVLVQRAKPEFLGVPSPPTPNQNVDGTLLGDLASDSDLIVIGTVISLRSAYDDSRTSIITYVAVTPERVLKGSFSGKGIEVRIPGGSVDDLSQKVSGWPDFAPRQKVALLLEGPDAKGQYTIPFGSLGRFLVEPHPTYREVAVVDSSYKGLDLIVPLGSPFRSLLEASEKRQLSLDRLISELGKR